MVPCRVPTLRMFEWTVDVNNPMEKKRPRKSSQSNIRQKDDTRSIRPNAFDGSHLTREITSLNKSIFARAKKKRLGKQAKTISCTILVSVIANSRPIDAKIEGIGKAHDDYNPQDLNRKRNTQAKKRFTTRDHWEDLQPIVEI